MQLLDDQKYLAKYDRSGVIRAIDVLADQARQAWNEARRVPVPATYRRVREIVMNGMGGSGLAGHIVEAAFRSNVRVPFFLTHGYRVPEHVGPHTLYIVSSYSGTTEEVLAAARVARARGAKLLGIASGGALGHAIDRNFPGYKFLPTYNPGNVPRLGQGYMIFGVLGLLKAARLLSLPETEIRGAITALTDAERRFGVRAALGRNRAKQLATKLAGKIVVFVGAEHLEDSARIMSNQLHETAKQFGFHFAIPELNHHLMEGLAFPRGVGEKLAFVFFQSGRYGARVQKRFPITMEVLRKHKIAVHTYRTSGGSALAEIAELLSFGGYVTYYLGMLNRVDPAPNPWVDSFKKRMGPRRSEK